MDEAAKDIRALRLNAPRNVLRVAEALQRISDIQFDLYVKRPGSIPKYLRNTVRFAGSGTGHQPKKGRPRRPGRRQTKRSSE